MTKKYISNILLVSYLLFVVHSGISHCHLSELCDPDNHSSHEHDGFNQIHHKHEFHVGIFHFIEHLFENVEHIDHQSHDHIAFQNLVTTQKINSNPDFTGLFPTIPGIGIRDSKKSKDQDHLRSQNYYLDLVPSIPVRGPPGLS